MKTKLPLLLLFFVLFLFKCDLKADPGHKSPLEYRWVNHPLDFYLNVTVDSTTTPHSLLFETMYEKKGIASFLLPIYQLLRLRSDIKRKIARIYSWQLPLSAIVRT